MTHQEGEHLMGSLGFQGYAAEPPRVSIEPSHYVTGSDGRIYAAIPKVGQQGQPTAAMYAPYSQPTEQHEAITTKERTPSRISGLFRFGATLALSGVATMMVGGTIFSGHASKDFGKDARIAQTMPKFVYDQYHWLLKERK